MKVKNHFLKNPPLCLQEGREPERYLGWADSFIVVYSVTCRESFATAQRYLEALSGPSSSSGPIFESPLLLVGTKADLESHRYKIYNTNSLPLSFSSPAVDQNCPRSERALLRSLLLRCYSNPEAVFASAV
jgi:GTPase SAR1 family protein